jgi:hypothetical protein
MCAAEDPPGGKVVTFSEMPSATAAASETPK